MNEVEFGYAKFSPPGQHVEYRAVVRLHLELRILLLARTLDHHHLVPQPCTPILQYPPPDRRAPTDPIAFPKLRTALPALILPHNLQLERLAVLLHCLLFHLASRPLLCLCCQHITGRVRAREFLCRLSCSCSMAPTRSPAPVRVANWAANSSSGCTPGLMVRIGQVAPRGNSPFRTAGTRPARTGRRLAAARRANHSQEAAGAQPLHQPLGQGVATVEELGVLFVEGLHATIGTNVFRWLCHCLRCTWRHTAYAAGQAVEGVIVVDSLLKIDPRQPTEKARELPTFGHGGSRQQHGHDTKVGRMGALVQRRPHLLVFPRPHAGPDPRKTAQVRLWSRAFSSASCQGSPGMRCHLSRNGAKPVWRNFTAKCSTAALSALLWLRKTS